MLLRAFHRQDNDCKNVEQRHTAQNHQGGHAGSAVNVLDERHAQNGRAAAVAGLYELTHQGFIFQQAARQHPDDHNGNGRYCKAEQDKLCIKAVGKVQGCHITEQHDRQRYLEHQLVGHGAELLWQKAFLPQRPSNDHHQKYRKGRVQAEH